MPARGCRDRPGSHVPHQTNTPMKPNLLPALGLLALASIPLIRSAGAAETVISPSVLQGWVFGNDGAPMGTAKFVTGPGTAPLGAGSVELSVADALERLS